ncbi:MAG: hypothetical protein QHJ73_19110, partial [Armatimonadota bacterium]|nr:hypothetical protein [Armatimonadota bacterium]
MPSQLGDSWRLARATPWWVALLVGLLLAPPGLAAPSDASAAAALNALVCPVETSARDAGANRLFLRGRHSMVLLPQGSGRVAVRLRAPARAPGVAPVYYRAVGADGKTVTSGQCPPGGEKLVPLSSSARRAFFVECGNQFATIQVEGAHYGLTASAQSPARLGPAAGRLSFLVPRGATAFTLYARAVHAGTGVGLQVFNPAGRLAAEAHPGPDGVTELRSTVDSNEAGAVWTFSLSSSGEGDAWVWLGPELPPFVAAAPELLAVPFIHFGAPSCLYLPAGGRSAPIQAAINVAPRPDRLIRASMRRAGSTTDLWRTKPAPFSTGQVRIVLPSDMPSGAYDLNTALLEREVRLIGT